MRVLVNDRLDVAIAARAHGVQLKGAGIGDAAARHLAPAGFLIGRSIHSVEEAVRTAADFLIFGTVYPTASKGPHQTVTGLEPLAAAARAASVPVLAIGGIDATRAPDVARVADGIAAIGWFSTIDRAKLAEAVREAREAFDSVEPPHLE
jgi:thiamine-phosphate diphosphorylase